MNGGGDRTRTGTMGWKEKEAKGDLGATHFALELSDQQTLEDLARLVAVSDVLERLGCVLSAHIEEDFLTTAIQNRVLAVFSATVMNKHPKFACFATRPRREKRHVSSVRE